MVLSCSQATVEKDFSEKKYMLVENLHMESLFFQRLICDYIKKKKFNPCNLPLSKLLVVHVKAVWLQYEVLQAVWDRSVIAGEKD